MEKNLIIVFGLLLVIAFVFWKLTSGPYVKEHGEIMMRLKGSGLFYWQFVIYFSAGMAVLLMFVLRWFGVLAF